MNVAIFGAGLWGHRVADYIIKTDDILVGFIDNNEELWHKKINIGSFAVEVYSKEEIMDFCIDKIIIAIQSVGQADIVNKELEAVCQTKTEIIKLREDPKLFFAVFSKTLRYNEGDHRVSFLRDFARFCDEERILGNIAECGVYTGEFSYYMNMYFPNRTLYLFDTFEGFDFRDVEKERSLNNNAFSDGEFNEEGIFDVNSIDIIKVKMPHIEKCVIKKGFFPDSAEGVLDSFCFVNLDMDLYQPMLAGLGFFYNKMNQGGIILCHDYYNPQLPGVRQAVSEFEESTKEIIHKFPIGDGQSIAILKG